METSDRAPALTWDDWWDDHYQLSEDFSRTELLALRQFPFLSTARDAQRPPKGDWRTWLFMGGRGAGKTRAGAEWVRFSALHGRCQRIALIAPTLGDAREVMIEGPSGIRSIERLEEFKPDYNVSRRRLEWKNGAIGLVFSAEDPDSLRGPQFDAAWCDEIAAWPYGEAVWDNLQFALRLGDDPRCVATTTPRPVPLVKRLISQGAMLTRSTTRENAANLAIGFVDQVEADYRGSALARQELEGELIEDIQGALWRRKTIDAHRVFRTPQCWEDIVVAVDPPASAHTASDACGIIVAGVAVKDVPERQCFVLEDATEQGLAPEGWAMRAVNLAESFGASEIIAEANQGGEMLRTVFTSVGCTLPVRLVNARLSKRTRALPVAALYSQGRVAHVGTFKDLEDEMCAFGTDAQTGSPDRVDALVWAVTVLMLDQTQHPRIRAL
ncbi:MAG: terminase family protein [Hyphomonadaceae bacterium]|nr:terminase family protein [Hyphomonadaceae bacterium]